MESGGEKVTSLSFNSRLNVWNVDTDDNIRPRAIQNFSGNNGKDAKRSIVFCPMDWKMSVSVGAEPLFIIDESVGFIAPKIQPKLIPVAV